jgi:intracellular sulfur oxidation DsrE/DsrF family protein
MKKHFTIICLLCLLGCSIPALAQETRYKAVYQLNSGDSNTIRATLRNIKNALEDPRLKNNITIELVVHSAGVTAFRKDQPYESLLKDLHTRGVLLMECENTLREKNISKSELFPFISYTPSGNGELIIKQHEGWAYVHP